MITSLRHDEHFLGDAMVLLREIEPCYPKYPEYKLQVKDGCYTSFLQFIIEELDNLPYENQVGKTILMRKDAPKVVADLSRNLKNQLKQLEQGCGWNNTLGSLEDYFSNRLEVFKNEIYPDMNLCGIGYNLDLGNLYVLDVTPIFRLERYFVDARASNSNKFTIKKNGSIDMRFLDGLMCLDLYESIPGGIHYE